MLAIPEMKFIVARTGASRAVVAAPMPGRCLHSRPTARGTHASRLKFVPRAGKSPDEGDDEFSYEEFTKDTEEEYDFEDPSVRLFLDSANHKEWEKWAETGLIYGFTTNPSILKRDGVQCTLPSMRQLARQAFDLEAGELHLQAWGSTMADLYSCSLDLYELDSRVVVKLPMTLEGLKAARRLVDDGVPVTFTAVYSAHQAVTALAAGATYIAPYLGRMNDAGKNGIEEITRMQSIIDLTTEYAGDVRLLVASIRHADEIAVLAAEGCNTFTISPAVAQQLVSDPLTLAAAEVFDEHAAEMGAMRDQ